MDYFQILQMSAIYIIIPRRMVIAGSSSSRFSTSRRCAALRILFPALFSCSLRYLVDICERFLNTRAFRDAMTSPSEQPVKGVVFDLDGTLIYFNIDWRGMLDELGMERCDILARIASQPEPQRSRSMDILDRYENGAVESSVPVDGVHELFDFLAKEGIPSAVVTRAGRERALVVIEKHGFPLDIVIGREDAPPKPAPDAIHEAAGLMGCSAAECLVVGDFKYDIEAGNNAGARTVLLKRDYPVEFKCDPDYRVDKLMDVAEIIGELNSGE